MKQYLDLLKDIQKNGVWKEPARPGMPRTKEVFGRMMKFDLSQGFPLLTTKKMFTKGIVAELLWFLRGETNIKFLVDNKCHIWDQDAYKYYKKLGGEYATLSLNDFVFEIEQGRMIQPFVDNGKTHEAREYVLGDCGLIYGYQWRKFRGWFDQIKNLQLSIKNNPDSRYHIITAWDPVSFLGNANNAALPACHMMFQCSVRDGYLDLIMTQRSCDTFLGVPFNVASYALLLTLLCKQLGLKPGVFTWVGNSVHVYENHMNAIKEQLSRKPYPLPHLVIEDRGQKELTDYAVSDFHFDEYISHPAIKAELSVGV